MTHFKTPSTTPHTTWTPTVPRDTNHGTDTFPRVRTSSRAYTLRPTARPWWRVLLQGLI